MVGLLIREAIASPFLPVAVQVPITAREETASDAEPG
jgi:hypothetical protein